MLSGHYPFRAIEEPTMFAGIPCKISVPREAVEEMRSILAEEVGPREQHLAWVTSEFSTQAGEVYAAIGSPTLTIETAWNVFASITQYIQSGSE